MARRFNDKDRQRRRPLPPQLSPLASLSEATARLVELSPEEDIHAAIADGIRLFSGAAIVVVSVYEPARNTTTVRAFRCPEPGLATAREILGTDLAGLTFSVPPETRATMTNEMVPVSGGLYSLCFEQLPQEICRQLEERLHIAEVRAMPFALGDDLLGTAAVITTEGAEAPSWNLVETYVRLAAVAAQRRKTEEALRRNEEASRRHFEELQTLYANAPVGLCEIDCELRWVRINDRLAEINGFPVAQHIGRRVRDLLPAIADVTEQTMREVIATGKPKHDLEIVDVTASGERRILRASWLPLRNGEGSVTGINVVVEDVTQERRREERIARLTVLYSILSRVNEAIVRVRDRDALCEKVCRIIAEEGRFPLVWVGEVENDRIFPTHWWGSQTAYIHEARFGADCQCPTSVCIRENRTVVDRAPEDRANETSWRTLATRHGFDAAVALPLSQESSTVAALTIYARNPQVFDDEQLRLLESLREDLSYALESLRRDALRSEAEQALRDLNANLEQRVLERTSALEEANARLERRAEQLRSLTAELLHTEDRERRKLAELLHDHLQQLLYAAKMKTEQLASRPDSGETQNAAREVVDLIGQSIQASRSLTMEISPPVLHDAGLVPALKWLGKWMKDTHGLKTEITAIETPLPLPWHMRLLLFVSVRELLFNVVKHAGVKNARIVMESAGPGLLRIAVSDDGNGFDPARRAARGGSSVFGLYNIEERLKLVDGGCEIEAAPGLGTRAVLTVPIEFSRGERARDLEAPKNSG